MEKRVSILSDNSSDSEIDLDINTDNSYARGYNKWRLKEDLQKNKSKNGDIGSSSSSSESEEEDVPQIEKNFLKTLSLLKSKDPKIYDENVKFFSELEQPKVKSRAKKPKPLYMKDYERKLLLETNGKLSGNDEENAIPPDIPSTYDKEQQEIKTSFKSALAESESGEESEDDLFQIRKKSDKEKEKDEAEYIQWLKGEKDHLPTEDANDKDLKYLHDYWNAPNLEEDEQFLKDYILNKKFVIEDNDSDAIPTYDEITNDIGTLSGDDELLEKQTVFEHKYNFRFEEPDSEFIKQYPRTIGDSLRRTDNKRKSKREEYQERKRQEKEQKREEIKRLKALKRAEIEEMLSKLRETSGDDKLNFDCADLDGDFDPKQHDKLMKELFNEEYYGVEEADKPELPYLEEFDDENWDNWTGEEPRNDDEAPNCEDPNFNMDADYDPKLEFQRKMIESLSKNSKKKRRKSKFAEAVAAAKPAFDPSSKKLEEYIDEYYNLDWEDVIGGEVFRFKYRNVVANDFGLSPNEILKARDKELNKWCSLKKTCQYRNEEEENYDLVAFKRKTENIGAKKKILPSLFEEAKVENTEASPDDSMPKKFRKRKRKSRQKNEAKSPENSGSTDEILNQEPSLKRSKIEEIGQTITENHGNPANYKESNAVCVPSTLGEPAQNVNVEKKKKHKKKKKRKLSDVADAESKKSSMPIRNATNRKQLSQGHGGMNYQNSNVDKRLQLSDARLKAYGVNPKKFKNRIKYSKKSKEMSF